MSSSGRPGHGTGAAETTGAALRRGARLLQRRGVAHPVHNARLLLAHALSTDLGGLALRLREPLPRSARETFGKLLCARGRRVPLQHLLGEWEFYGIALECGPEALIPRPETELLVERALAHLGDGPARVADVGTGTGAIAIALALHRPRLEVWAIDRSAEALELASRNVRRHELEDRIQLVEGDLLSGLDGRVEPGSLAAIVSNPPYVAASELDGLEPEVRDHDPRIALVAGETGLEILARLAVDASPWLATDGWLLLEMGQGQEAGIRAALERAGTWGAIRVHPDFAGIPRVVEAARESRSAARGERGAGDDTGRRP